MIYPYGGELPAVMVDYHPRVARLPAARPGMTLVQGGDHDKTFSFPSSHFLRVANIVMPYRRRRLAPAVKARAADRLRAIAARNAHNKNDRTPQE